MQKRLYKEQNRQLEIFSLWRKQSETPCKSILPPMFYNFFVKTAMLVGWRDHQIYTLMMAQAKFGSNWPSVFRGEHLQIINCCHLWIEVRVFGYNFEMVPPKVLQCKCWLNLVQQFQRRRFLNDFFLLKPALLAYLRKKNNKHKLFWQNVYHMLYFSLKWT